jgi:hypothetical protein
MKDMVTNLLSIKKFTMKKITYLLLVIIIGVALYSCNKPVTSYPTVTPWSGIAPMSGIINNKSFLGASGYVFITDTTPVFISSTSSETFGGDSSITKTITVMLPKLGGSVNTLIYVDSTNRNYGITYTEVLKKGTIELKNKSYYTFQTDKACTLKLLEYNAVLAKGIYSGFLRNVNNSNEYVEITNGFFNINK